MADLLFICCLVYGVFVTAAIQSKAAGSRGPGNVLRTLALPSLPLSCALCVLLSVSADQGDALGHRRYCFMVKNTSGIPWPSSC